MEIKLKLDEGKVKLRTEEVFSSGDFSVKEFIIDDYNTGLYIAIKNGNEEREFFKIAYTFYNYRLSKDHEALKFLMKEEEIQYLDLMDSPHAIVCADFLRSINCVES